MSDEKIIKVIIDGALPKTCGSCYHIVVRPKGRRVFWECYFVEGSIESRDMVRPEWCPLVSKRQIEKFIINPQLDSAWHILMDIVKLSWEDEEK